MKESAAYAKRII